MISTANLSIQFGAKPLFENVSVTFGNGNRYGLIGANGCGKSTLMKILAGELEPSAGNVSTDPNARVGQLRQDQFAYEQHRVLDAVIMGYERLWEVMQERDRLYSLPEMSDEEGMRVADLEVEFAEMDGYSAEARAGELLEGIGIPVEQHEGPMSAIAPGWKLRVLLAQALFSDPDVLLLDEPTNNLDINAIRWLEGFLDTSKATMVIISHDRHFLNSVCSHMADLDYGKLQVFPGNYDEYMTAAMQARERVHADNAKKESEDGGPAGVCQPLLCECLESPPGNIARQAAGKDRARGHRAIESRESLHSLRAGQSLASNCSRGNGHQQGI